MAQDYQAIEARLDRFGELLGAIREDMAAIRGAAAAQERFCRRCQTTIDGHDAALFGEGGLAERTRSLEDTRRMWRWGLGAFGTVLVAVGACLLTWYLG